MDGGSVAETGIKENMYKKGECKALSFTSSFFIDIMFSVFCVKIVLETELSGMMYRTSAKQLHTKGG